jgi:hypothetical protein
MEILKALADNPALLEAVKKLLVDKFSVDTLSVNTSNEILGQAVRARLDGLRVVEEAFKEIAKYKSVPTLPERKNEAR